MNKLVMMFFLLVADTAFADEFLVAGDPYKGQPVICSTHRDAAELAEIYINKSTEEFSGALSIKTKESLCFSKITVGFVPIKEVSVHKGKETVYVIEIMPNGIYYIIDPHPVVSRPYRRKAAV